ncbi:hypothetical protein DEO72_LG8g2229 [Vigna unguiculata]|uniref:Uncharacterized protein n=1 Tax=Vigna unguiculata TaxID=3917 RepID=A0A4D6MRX4_VIGUN|nr:hypothetical protein DEO72_LG8g2229 [Vigna unguiculata]
MSSTRDSVSLSSLSSGSMQSKENVGRRLEEGSVSPMAVVGRIPMETITEVREDPPENHVIARDVDRGIVSLERVAARRLCYGGAPPIKRSAYLTTSEQLGILAGFLCSLSIVVSATVSPFIFILLRHEAPTTDNMAILVKEGGRSHFLNADGSTKYPFSWTGHMAQVGKKNLTKFQALRKEKAVKAKAVGNTEVPNLQESLVEVHVHNGTKRKAELPARPSRGKDVKKMRVALLGQGSSSGAKGPKVGLIELSETTVRKDIEINMTETLINSIDSMESDPLVRTMVEFSNKALILSRRVGSMYRREMKEGNREKLEDLQGKVDKFAEEKAAWEKEREEWKEEKKEVGDLKGSLFGFRDEA